MLLLTSLLSPLLHDLAENDSCLAACLLLLQQQKREWMEEVAEGELYIIEKLIPGHAAALISLNVKNEHENVLKNIGEKQP